MKCDAGSRPKCRTDCHVGNMFVRVDCPADFLESLHADFDAMGVDDDCDTECSSNGDGQPVVCFAHRDRARVVSYKDAEGNRKQKRFHVSKYERGTKKYLAQEEYSVERERSHERAKEWIHSNFL